MAPHHPNRLSIPVEDEGIAVQGGLVGQWELTNNILGGLFAVIFLAAFSLLMLVVTVQFCMRYAWPPAPFHRLGG